MGCQSLLQGIFPTQGSNSHLMFPALAGGFFTASTIWEAPKRGQFSSVQLLSHVQLSATAWTAAHQASLSITNSQNLLKLMSIESVMPSNHLFLCRLLLLSPSIFPGIRVSSNESALRIRGPKYWSFSFNISPSNNTLAIKQSQAPLCPPQEP